MSDSAPGFAQFVPGFDFLQSLAKGASSGLPQMPSLANWVAPTLNAEELDKRITELKAVHFWLEQNTRALSATIQALEVQKLTLATLHGMNVGLGEVASAFKFPSAEAPASTPRPAAPAPAPKPETAAAGPARARRGRQAQETEPSPALVDPLKLWGALTQQFQEIANAALKDVAKASAAVEAAHQDAPAPSSGRAGASAAPAARRARARAPASGAPARGARKAGSARKGAG